MNDLHKRWDPKLSLPILNTPRYNEQLQEISPTTYHPYDLYEESIYLSNQIYRRELSRFVLALWQLKFTTNKLLIAELLNQQQSELITREEMINHLKWCVQHTHPRFQLSWISVKYY